MVYQAHKIGSNMGGLSSPVIVALLALFIMMGTAAVCFAAESSQDSDSVFKQDLSAAQEAKEPEQLRQALPKLEHWLKMMKERGDRLRQAEVLLAMGGVLARLKEFDKGLEACTEALKLYRDLGDRNQELLAMFAIGALHKKAGNGDKAIEQLEAALALAEQYKDKEMMGAAATFLSWRYNASKQVGKAIAMREKSVAIYRELGNREAEAQQLYEMGGYYAAAQKIAEAMKTYEQAMAIYADLKDTKGQAGTLIALANLYRESGQYEKAWELWERCLAQTREAKNPESESLALHNLGLVFKNWGQHEKAKEYYEQALSIRRKLKDRRGERDTLTGLGDLFRKTGQREKANEYYEQSLTIIRDLGDRPAEAWLLYKVGELCTDMGKSDEAIKSYEQAIKIYENINERSWKAAALMNIGHIHRKRRQHEKAEVQFNSALKIAGETKDLRLEAAALDGLAKTYKAQEEYGRAVELYERVLAIQRERKDRRGEMHTLGNLGNVYKALCKYDIAAANYRKCLRISRELQSHQSEAQALNGLGNVHFYWGQYSKAVSFFEKSLAISEDMKDRGNQGGTLSNLGSVFRDWNRYDKAVSYYEKALAIFRDLQDRNGEGNTLNNLGSVYHKCGRYDKAVENYEKSLAIAKDFADREAKANAWLNLGNCYLFWGQYDKAVENYEKALLMYQDLKNRRGESITLNNVGLVLVDLGQYDKAQEILERSLAIKRELKDKRGEGKALLNIGRVFQQGRQLEEALAQLEKGIVIYTSIKVPTNWPKGLIAEVYMDKGDLAHAEPLLKEVDYNPHWGRYYLLKSDFHKAKGYYKQILKSAKRNRGADHFFIAYTGLARSCEGLGNYEQAQQYYRKAVDFSEELRSSLTAQQREKFFDVRINGFHRTAPYEGLARVLQRMGKQNKAFTTSEFTKARVFAEGISSRAGEHSYDVPQDVVKRDAQLLDQLSALKKQLQKAYEKNNKLAIQALEPQIEKLEKEFAVQKKMLRDKYPLFAATRYPQPMALSESAMKDDEWVLSYDVTDPSILIYLTKGKKLVKSLFKPVARREVDALVRAFRKPLEMEGDLDTDKLARFDLGTGKKLADLLLADVLGDLPKDTPVMIVPDDCLGVLPFEMLVLNSNGKIATDRPIPYPVGVEFFGDRNPISYCQSITALTLARTFAKSRDTGTRSFVMDDPVFKPEDPRIEDQSPKTDVALMAAVTRDRLMSMEKEKGITFPRLPATAVLGKHLKQLNPTITDRYTGMDASKPRLFDGPLNQYQSMVFATHGYFGKDLPGIMEPVLVLTLLDQPEGRDGFLRLSEVMGLKLNADVVALTACQTGLGRRLSGEGTMGMGRAFQYAGAKSVLMSLWSVEQTASAKLAEGFFKHLKEGKTKLEALRLARQAIRKQGFDHPFFWAAFILVGETQ